jgi:hypothetical protein
MSRTLLQLIQQASDELGLPQPSQVLGTVDDQSRQLLALAIREGKDFSAMANGSGGWQKLHKEYVFFTQVNSATTGDITSGSTIVTGIGDLTSVTADTWFVSGTGLADKAKVVSVDSGTQVTLDRPCTATTSGVELTFAQGGYDLPSDLEYFVQKSFWDGTYQWQLLGPISAQEKNVLKYGISPSGPRRRFFIRNDKMYFDPIPGTDNETIAYDYYSNAWCEDASGTGQTYWQADTDIYRLDEDCFVQGIKWRFLRAKGLDYGEEKGNYLIECQRVLSRDGGNRDLPTNASSTSGFSLLSNDQVPDTGFGS